MEKELLEQLQLILNSMATKDDIQSLQGDVHSLQGDVHSLQGDVHSLNEEMYDLKAITINLENSLTVRLESLFDGNKLTHEKQWELERKVEKLEKRLEALEIKTA